MQGNNISKRLKFLIDLCPSFNIYADVGCDHGYTALNLIKQKKCNFVYCIDIHNLSLEKSKQLFMQNNLDNVVKFYCSDGFSKLSKEEQQQIDCAVIAGMGGIETIKILSVYQPKNLVLQPMHNQKELREFLLNNGYNIIKDIVFCENNKYYIFLLCEKDNSITKYNAFELQFGKYNEKADYINYLQFQKNKYLKIYNKTHNKDILNILQNLENVLK